MAKKRSKAPKRDVQRAVLDNGVRVVTERVTGKSAAFGVWVDAGSRFEELKDSGATHVIQRAAFHGAADRSAAQIAKAIEALGGKVGAETGRDYALYRVEARVDSADEALALLADLALRPKLDQTAVTAEKRKILDELVEDEDDPDFNIERMFLRSLWKGHGLCRSPRGRLLTVKGKPRLEDFKAKALARFHQQSHRPSAITVTLAGNLAHDEALSKIEKLFGDLEEPKKRVTTTTPSGYRFLALRNRPDFPKVRAMMGVPACGAADEEHYAARLLNALLGGAEVSRLSALTTAKELPAEQAESTLEMFADTGCLTVKLRASRKGAAAAIEAVIAEFKRLATGAIDEAEVERARDAEKARLLAALESPMSRIRDLAARERYFGELKPIAEEFEAIDAVSAAKVKNLATLWIAPHLLSVAVLGNLKGVDIKPRMLRW